MATMMRLRIRTVGHSTRELDELVDLLRAHGVQTVVDVRTVPRSRRNPQFNRDELAESLASRGLRYLHMPGLGGLRHPRPDSINAGWRNAGFRGYADHMASPEFARSLEALVSEATRSPLAIMCAEAVPWRCHRSLISDALTVRGVAVEHVLTATRAEPHTLTPFARVDGMAITYPRQGAEDGEDEQGSLPFEG
jgi:uncharacterized protein (DUF488 family)